MSELKFYWSSYLCSLNFNPEKFSIEELLTVIVSVSNPSQTPLSLVSRSQKGEYVYGIFVQNIFTNLLISLQFYIPFFLN